MGEIISLDRSRPKNRNVERALRILLHKAKQGELTGFAFVGIKHAGICAGTVNICHSQDEALEATGRLMDAILGKEPFIEPLDPLR